MNLPNRLTVARLFLTLVFVIVLTVQWRFSHTLALAIFVIASLTDYADGEIARRYGMVTNFGKLMDPLVDKILTAAAFICLVPLGLIPAWVVIVIVSREFLITGLRLLASAQGKVLPAEKMGKHKTTWQIITILFFLIVLAWPELMNLRLPAQILLYTGWALTAVMLAFTVYSGFGYFWKNRALIGER